MSLVKPPLDDAGEQQWIGTFRQRAQQLAGRGRQEDRRRTDVRVLILRNADERFGIELAHVEQVFPRVELTPVPGASHPLVGVANLNGLPRSVFDFSRLLDSRSAISNTSYIVLLKVHGRKLGLAVEGVDGVRGMEIENLLSVDANGSTDRLLKGMTEDHVGVLDTNVLLERIVHQPEAQAREQNTLAGAEG
jgi:purine-binding chemotaxis protein CheW